MNVLDPTFLRDLNDFLGQAFPNTYAGGGESVGSGELQRPGFKELVYRDGLWSYRDSYTGFLTATGQEVVLYNDVPVWTMSYGGGMNSGHRQEHLAKECFTFLKTALCRGETSVPFQPRGPGEHSSFPWHYHCEWSGAIDDFRGREVIHNYDISPLPIFFHEFFGGVIVLKP